MSATSSSGENWSSRLELPRPAERIFSRDDDPRLGDVIELWRGHLAAVTEGRPVLVGFPQDEGVRRNGGRPGAAEAPAEVRRWLSRLVPYDGEKDVDLARVPPLDVGNVRGGGTLEETQDALGEVLAGLLSRGAVPIVLGGGHETALGHYLGYVKSRISVGIVNLDAHLDVRPYPDGRGHSGSPFRQAMEHPTTPLPGERYVCLGAQAHVIAKAHLEYARQRGCIVGWRADCANRLGELVQGEVKRLEKLGCRTMLTVDADAVDVAWVPGVSAPNSRGLSGAEVLDCVRKAGESMQVASLDVVEINPRLDRDGQSARWAALLVWSFLAGLAARPRVGLWQLREER